MEQLQQVQSPKPPVKCPRCDSSNTKFCYYNNYSLSQPRHLCKACKRYWTRGGSLRNVPVGGGCRKNKTKVIINKQSSSSSSSSANFAPILMTSSSPLAKPSSTANLNTSPYSIRSGMSLLPQFNSRGGGGGDGLGFSSLVTSQNFGSGYATNVVTSSSYDPHFGTGFQQQNMVSSGFKDITTQTVPYGSFLGLDEVEILLRNEKLMEGHGNTITTTNYDQNYIIEDDHHDEINYLSSDPPLPFMWNSSTTWHHDYSSSSSSNIIGSSVPSLI